MMSEMEYRYQRAQTLIQGFMTENLVQNDTIIPTWIEGSDYFWFKRVYKIDKDSTTQIGREYRLVNTKKATNELAFDHGTFAKALSEVSGKEVDLQALPLSHISFTLSPLELNFTAFGQQWKFEAETKCCRALEMSIIQGDEAISPDGKWIAFPKDNNLWLREVATGKDQALTNDGEKDCSYALGSAAWGKRAFLELPALWSPDSTRLLTVQRDKRQVKNLPHVSHVPVDGSIRPQLENYKVAYPGDKAVETFQILCFDLLSGQRCDAQRRPSPSCFDGELGSFFKKVVWWAADSQHAYFIDRERGDQVLRLVEFDTNTGVTQVLIEESSDTHVNITTDCQGLPLFRHLASTNEMIWWSERSGWGHLYLYDLNNGKLKHAITSGGWLVRDILHVDEKRRELLIQTSARVAERDPYYRDICRVNIDTGEITTLLSSDDEYVVHYPNTLITKQLAGEASEETCGVAPNGDYIVTTCTRADQVPTNLLIDRNGKKIMELAVADISMLPLGFKWPEPVKLLAADGHTAIYGLLFRPSDFSPKKLYPVINFINGGPWLSAVPKGSFHTSRGYADRHYFHAASLAELGFIVLILDSRGTPLRSKAFQDTSYGWIPSAANTEDHTSAIQQLAERYPYMDINRVGAYGDGYLSCLQNFLEKQNLYKVGVQMNLMDSRLVSCIIEGDKYQGVEGPSDDKLYPEQLVDKLSGKLCLMTALNSFISPFYPPAALFRMIDALQKANKDFDMLVIPNVIFGVNNYMRRRSWDYLVKHLRGEVPPKEFSLGEVSIAGVPKELLENPQNLDE